MKYIICFRGSDHPHDALKDGIKPHGGQSGPIEYQGAIDTDSAVPMSTRLSVAAFFPNANPGDIQAENSLTTIDVILVPLPEEEDEILQSKIKASNSTSLKVLESALNEAQSESHFVNTSSNQILDSLIALKAAVLEVERIAENLKNDDRKPVQFLSDDNILSLSAEIASNEASPTDEEKNEDNDEGNDEDELTANDLIDTTYDELSGMVWSHELASKEVPKEWVVASMQCQRKDGYFSISDIRLQEDEVMNNEFLRAGHKEDLVKFLEQYRTPHLLPQNEGRQSYRGYYNITGTGAVEDFRDIHRDGIYQIYLEEIQSFCDKHKTPFTHENNMTLMKTYKTKTFDITQFCTELYQKHLDKMPRPAHGTTLFDHKKQSNESGMESKKEPNFTKK